MMRRALRARTVGMLVGTLDDASRVRRPPPWLPAPKGAAVGGRALGALGVQSEAAQFLVFPVPVASTKANTLSVRADVSWEHLLPGARFHFERTAAARLTGTVRAC